MAQGKGGGGKAIVGVILGCGCLIVGIGILAAIAIPAFISYTKGSKTEEARSNLRLISTGAASYFMEERMGADGRIDTGRLPTRLSRTPAEVPCGQAVMWPLQADPGWEAFGFRPADPIRYSYEWEASEDGSRWVARALGDLDCDGVSSTFELHGTVTGDGELEPEPELRVFNELE